MAAQWVVTKEALADYLQKLACKCDDESDQILLSLEAAEVKNNWIPAGLKYKPWEPKDMVMEDVPLGGVAKIEEAMARASLQATAAKEKKKLNVAIRVERAKEKAKEARKQKEKKRLADKRKEKKAQETEMQTTRRKAREAEDRKVRRWSAKRAAAANA